MKHLRNIPTHRTQYHSDAQRTHQIGEHLAAMWVAEDVHDLQQHMWLATVYLIAVGGNAEGTIATLEGLLIAMRDHGDVVNAWMYDNRLQTMRRNNWRMVHTAQEFHWEHFVGKRDSIPEDYPVIE